jgi:predicted glycosyltransferase
MKVWIDVDNPPQVQYLVPFAGAFRAAGADVVLTARDYGETLELLLARGVGVHVVGRRFGRSALRKRIGTLVRAGGLAAHLLRSGRPDVLLCASRSGAIAAAALGIPSFVLADYEHASVGIYRLTRSVFLHPESIDTAAWLARGLRPERLVAFRGIKEDISFDGVDLDAVAAHPLPGEGRVRVLLRPPAEDSHYYAPASRMLTLALLGRLARREDVQLVFAPRYPRQRSDLDALPWRNAPIVLEEPVPFVPLLKSVDLVVSSGGTMLREAAYLGIPAYTILRSAIGGVDRWLESIGRVHVLRDETELETIELRRRGPLDALRANPRLLEELTGIVLAGARPHGRRDADRLVSGHASTPSGQ